MKFKVFQKGKEIFGDIPLENFKTNATGVFESLRTYEGKIFKLDEHLARLYESAKTLGLTLPSPTKVKKEIQQAATLFSGKDVFLRVTFWRGELCVLVGDRRHSEAIYEKGVQLQTSSFLYPGPNSWANQAKATAYQLAVLTSTLPKAENVYEWVFVTAEGFVTECRIGNIFLVKKGKAPELLTPPEHFVLNGVTRRFVIECALKLGLKVRAEPFSRHDFFNADEAFLSNTSWEILPVRSLDGRKISDGKPGPITNELHKKFKREVKQLCR